MCKCGHPRGHHASGIGKCYQHRDQEGHTWCLHIGCYCHEYFVRGINQFEEAADDDCAAAIEQRVHRCTGCGRTDITEDELARNGYDGHVIQGSIPDLCGPVEALVKEGE